MKRVLLGIVIMVLGSGVQAEAASEFTSSKICKAAVSAMMGKKPSIMKTKIVKPEIVSVSYRRPSDNSLWGFDCKLADGNQIIWRSGTEPSDPKHVGRWRTDPNDEQVTYEISGDELTIHDSIGGDQVFSISDL